MIEVLIALIFFFFIAVLLHIVNKTDAMLTNYKEEIKELKDKIDVFKQELKFAKRHIDQVNENRKQIILINSRLGDIVSHLVNYRKAIEVLQSNQDFIIATLDLEAEQVNPEWIDKAINKDLGE